MQILCIFKCFSLVFKKSNCQFAIKRIAFQSEIINLVPRARVLSGQRQQMELLDNPFSRNSDSGFLFQGAWVPVMAAKSKSTDHFHWAIKFSLRKLGKGEAFFLNKQQIIILMAVAIVMKDVLAVFPT